MDAPARTTIRLGRWLDPVSGAWQPPADLEAGGGRVVRLEPVREDGGAARVGSQPTIDLSGLWARLFREELAEVEGECVAVETIVKFGATQQLRTPMRARIVVSRQG